MWKEKWRGEKKKRKEKKVFSIQGRYIFKEHSRNAYYKNGQYSQESPTLTLDHRCLSLRKLKCPPTPAGPGSKGKRSESLLLTVALSPK